MSNLKSKKEAYSFSKSVEINDMRKSVSIREVENGYIIDISKSYEDEDEGYVHENKTYISKVNPMDKIAEDKDDDKKDDVELAAMLSSLDEI